MSYWLFEVQVITNFSRAKSKVLEASFQLNNRHIFLVHDITMKVQKYLSSHPSVETVKATPICYLKSMEKDGPQIALSCVIKTVVSLLPPPSLFRNFLRCISSSSLSRGTSKSWGDLLFNLNLPTCREVRRSTSTSKRSSFMWPRSSQTSWGTILRSRLSKFPTVRICKLLLVAKVYWCSWIIP